MGGSIFKTILPIAATAIGGPGLGAAVSGGMTLAGGGNIGQALGSAAGSYFSGGGAGNIGPAGTLASSLGGLGSLGTRFANALPASWAGSSLSELAGGIAGTLSGNSGESAAPQSSQSAAPSSEPLARRTDPGSLPSQFGGLDPTQQSTGIATQGVYGGGAGRDENQYFLNLINSRLSDTQDMGSLKPIESSYLDQLGLGGANNYEELLKKISQYHP